MRLPIASGLTPGQHVVRLTVADWDPALGSVDAFEVNAGQPPAFPFLSTGLLAAGVLVAAALLALNLRRRPRREQFF